MENLQEFTMTEQEEQDLRSAAESNEYTVIRFWEKLGNKYGFDPSTVAPIMGVGAIKFKAKSTC